jgi:uncharacterized protein (TIGR04222 family)
MDTLLHNPVADMYGPYFLLFYGSVITTTLIVCWRLVQDPTKNQPLPLIPSEPNPYEIAYLRSQETGVAHLALFNLTQHGYLQVNKQSISQAPNYPDTSNLEPIERRVFEKFSTPATATASLWLTSQCVQPFCTVYQEQLENQQLLYTTEQQGWNIGVGIIGAIMIFSLGAYKLLIALGKGRYNVGFLIIMGVLSIIYLLWFVSQRHTHLSHLGKRYLQQLQTTFAQLRETSILNNNLLVVALFGVESLAGTAYDAYYKAFFPPAYSTTSSRSSRSSSSSCSSSGCSSCSSSSCSSSSCGSSCGGGCGGCGG